MKRRFWYQNPREKIQQLTVKNPIVSLWHKTMISYQQVIREGTEKVGAKSDVCRQSNSAAICYQNAVAVKILYYYSINKTASQNEVKIEKKNKLVGLSDASRLFGLFFCPA